MSRKLGVTGRIVKVNSKVKFLTVSRLISKLRAIYKYRSRFPLPTLHAVYMGYCEKQSKKGIVNSLFIKYIKMI